MSTADSYHSLAMHRPPRLTIVPKHSTPSRILILGEENAWLTGWVRDCVRRWSVHQEDQLSSEWVSADEAIATLPAQPDSVATVLLTQERPGQLARALPDQLRAAAPNVRLLSVAGSWCEGELRTGAPHEGVERIYWYDLPGWLESNLTDRESTATRRHVVCVDAVQRETAAAIIDTLAAAGHAAVWAPRHTAQPLSAGYTAGVWVGAQLDGRSAAMLADFCRTMRQTAAPVIALLDFPRHDELALAERVGASALLGKPWSADDLLRTLERVTVAKLSDIQAKRLAA